MSSPSPSHLPPFRSDKELIDAIKVGGSRKEQAVSVFIQQYGGYMHKLQKKIGLSIEDIQDAYTDAIVALVQHIETDGFRGESKLSTFFYRIFFNKGVDLARKRSTKGVNTVYDIPQIQDPAKNILDLLNMEDEIERLHGYLRHVGDTCKQILLDWGFWGYRMSEIAERAGLKDADQAKRQKYRCLKKLTELIKSANQND